ncbi:S9 family peptidase [Phenylobacterium sp. J367]|uniref:alpha/beta hydrolase family protein n=1 Tax=Phenylobacterium sp. J367 TaxID=2898435 RepID=UPI002151A4B6|nr:hypothetical protein [Phenylobacterium sp. J367]MCR5880505.1 hypothetical protein [Phenylobacterium sp. J367]
MFSNACGAETFPQMVGDHFADTSPARLLPTGVPIALVHGTWDHVMPPFAGRQYAQKVRAAGDVAEVVVPEGAGHFDVVIPTTPAWETVADLVARAFGDR